MKRGSQTQRMLLTVLAVVLGIYLVLMLAIAWLSLHPLRTPIFVSPGLMGTPQEDVMIEESRRLRGWWVQSPDQKLVVVHVHGYLMNRAEMAPVAFQLFEHGVSSLLVDLRAHGKSGGKKCTLGHLEREDVKSALRFARARANGAPVVVLGSSMGSAASALALGDEPDLADGLVMDSGFSKLSNAILGWWRFLGGNTLMVLLAPTVYLATPMAGFWPFGVDIAAALSKMGEKPVIFFHGGKDTLALPTEAQRNFEATKGPREIVWFEGYGHSEFRWEQPEKYIAALLAFLRKNALLPP